MLDIFQVVFLLALVSTANGSLESLNLTLLDLFDDCLLSIKESDIAHNVSTLWGQPVCHEYHQRHNWCNLGFSQHYELEGNAPADERSIPSEGGNCFTRSITERETIHHHWRDPEAEAADAGIRDSIMLTFLESMMKYGYKSMHFFGDSITLQMAHFMSCDFLRSKSKFFRVDSCSGRALDLVAGDRFSGCNIVSLMDSDGKVQHQVSLLVTKTAPPCVYLNWHHMCNDPANMPTLYGGFYGSLFNNTFSSKRDTIVVFNAGLHQFPTVGPNASKLMAKHLLQTASAFDNNHNLMVFRETSAQHFTYTADGSFEGAKLRLGTHAHCCDSIRTPREMNKYDALIVEELDRLRPDWRERIGWARVYAHTRDTGADQHVEFGGKRSDCTHFMYNSKGPGDSMSNNFIGALSDSLRIVEELRAKHITKL